MLKSRMFCIRLISVESIASAFRHSCAMLFLKNVFILFKSPCSRVALMRWLVKENLSLACLRMASHTYNTIHNVFYKKNSLHKKCQEKNKNLHFSAFCQNRRPLSQLSHQIHLSLWWSENTSGGHPCAHKWC